MKDKENYFEKIDDYLLGHLSEIENTKFEKALESDEALAKAVAAQERIRKGMMEGGRRKLRAELKAIHQEVVFSDESSYSDEPSAKVRKLNWRPMVAAAAVLLLGVLAWWLWGGQGVSPERLFAQNFEAYDLVLNQRDEGKGEQLPKLIELYDAKKYEVAKPMLESMLKEDVTNSQLRLALAIARFETNETTTAFKPLTEIIQSEDPFLSDLAKWYSALFHLRLNQIEQALPFLQALADDPDADKHQAAKKILQQIQ